MLGLSTEIYGKHVDDLSDHEIGCLMEIAAMKWLEQESIEDRVKEGSN